MPRELTVKRPTGVGPPPSPIMVEDSRSVFDGITEDQCELMNGALWGRQVRVDSRSPNSDGPTEHIFETVMLARHMHKGLLVPAVMAFRTVGDIQLRSLENSGVTRNLSMSWCTHFEVVGPEFLQCSWCARWFLRHQLLNEDSNWHRERGDQPEYELECVDCVARWNQ